MKKMLAFLLAITLFVGLIPAFAEGVVVIDDTQQNATESTFEDMLLDVPIDVGDYEFTVQKAEIEDRTLILEIKVFNYLPKSVQFFKDAKVVVTYVGERNEYVFNGYGCRWYDPWGNGSYRWGSGDPSITVNQLTSHVARFECDLPAYVIENQGELKMVVSSGSMVFTYYFRR